jgi:predicted transcriptional regulator
MINGQKGAFGNRMIQFHVNPFTKKENDKYLNGRVPEINFTDDGLKRFYECTRGIPAYINSFCNTLSSNETYDNEMVEKTFFQKMDQIIVMWIKIWGTLSLKERDIIISIVGNGSQTWTNLQQSTGFSTNTFNKYLDILKNKGIVVYDKIEGYKIEDQMLKAWIEYKKEIDGYYPP